ncbi:MAG TPA: arginine--tRNA ligase, partial [Candidatus Enterocola sp.]|nr:arginine--tRNA ligase [Candidatus Enterocola sp.]
MEQELIANIQSVVKQLYGQEVDASILSLQKTKKEFEGDLTLVVFPLLKISHKKPEETAQEIGNKLKSDCPLVSDFNVIKGFLNLTLADKGFVDTLASIDSDEYFGFKKATETSPLIMVEYSSPNTNKPLHLGHIRNNLLGYSLSKILEANGNKVVKTNIVNDRGIHICKSMLAWQKFGAGATPESTSLKGDHLVGDYYVAFDKAYKAEVKQLMEEKSMLEDDAKRQAPLMLEAQEMLRKWEANDADVRNLWKTMNEWVYKGFDETYKRLGVSFDKIYYESETYLVGKDKVAEGLSKGIF